MGLGIMTSSTKRYRNAAFVSSAVCIGPRQRTAAVTNLGNYRQPSSWIPNAAGVRHRFSSFATQTLFKRPRSRPTLVCSANRTATPSSEQVPDYPLGPPGSLERFAPKYWLQGLRDDLKRRVPLYLSDWTDGFRFKSVSVILFLYFACLGPVVAFGGLTSALTGGSMGVVEFLLSSGATGMLYAVTSGQPLTFISPTGLTLAFTTALYGFCRMAGVAFLPMYAWVGIWTSAMLVLAAIGNFSDLIKLCTRFTEDIFNSLIATNFLYEASRALIGAFFVVGADKTNPLTALAIALMTFFAARLLTGLRNSRYLWKNARSTLADFGPVLAIAIMSGITVIPAVAKVGLARLSIPSTFQLAGGRAPLVPLAALPIPFRLVAIVPALLLTCLFYLDQNISTRVVNSPVHNLKKGPGYHLDMLILAICTLVCSLFGLPWMCAGTVQSIAHIQALAEVEVRNGKAKIVSVLENRLTPFLVHTGILVSLFLLSLVKQIPMAVVSGLFLFLGTSMLNNNEFLSRIRYIFMDPNLYPDDSPMRAKKIPAKQVHAFTALQVSCLALLWILKLNKKTAMFFPSVIATLMFIRSRIATKFLPATTLDALDGDFVEGDHEEVDDTATSDPQLSGAG